MKMRLAASMARRLLVLTFFVVGGIVADCAHIPPSDGTCSAACSRLATFKCPRAGTVDDCTDTCLRIGSDVFTTCLATSNSCAEVDQCDPP